MSAPIINFHVVKEVQKGVYKAFSVQVNYCNVSLIMYITDLSLNVSWLQAQVKWSTHLKYLAGLLCVSSSSDFLYTIQTKSFLNNHLL